MPSNDDLPGRIVRRPDGLGIEPEGGGKTRPLKPNACDDPELASWVASGDDRAVGLAVVFRVQKGSIRGVRRPDVAPQRRRQPAASAEPPGTPKPPPKGPAGGRPSAGDGGVLWQFPFHNPYGFVPFVCRVRTGLFADGDAPPLGTFSGGRLSGTLDVSLEVVTPLLTVDGARGTVDDSGHKVLPLRRSPDGRPYLPPTSLKGAIRSAFEAITNSRLGVFAGHDDPLGYRESTQDGLGAVPVRVVRDGDQLFAELLTGTSKMQPDDKPAKNDPMYAAWLPMYSRKKDEVCALADGSKPEHGHRYQARVELREHKRGFRYWKVRAIAREGEPLPPPQAHGERPETRVVTGWAVITNHNIKNKHDERLFFFHGPGQPKRLPIPSDVANRWRALVDNARSANERVLRARKGNETEYRGHEPGQTALSPHLYDKGRGKLEDGSLCYAVVITGRDGLTIEDLKPVMISRRVHRDSPARLLDPEFAPASTAAELSPADRLFGWVSPAGAGVDAPARRGRVRIATVTCDQVSTSNNSSIVPYPPGRVMNPSASSIMRALRVWISLTISSFVKPVV